MIKKLLIFYPTTEWGEHAAVVPTHIVRLASYIIENSNIEVDLIDSQNDIGIPLTQNGVSNEIKEAVRIILLKADKNTLLGFSLTSAQDVVSVLPIMKELRKNLTIPIVLGGYGASTNFRLLLKNYPELIEAIVIGPGELPLLEIINKYSGNRISLQNIDGVAWFDGKEVHYKKQKLFYPRIKNYYWNLLPRLSNYVCIATSFSFSCGYKCNFCCEKTITGKSFEIDLIDFENLIQSIRINFPRVTNIWLTDPNIGGGDFYKTSLLLSIIAESGLKVFFNARVDTIKPHSAFEKIAKDWVVYLGLESADCETLLAMNKTRNPNNYLESFTKIYNYFSDLNILPMIGLIVNFPLISRNNFSNTLTFLKKLMDNSTNSPYGRILSASIFMLHSNDEMFNNLNYYESNGCVFQSTFQDYYHGVSVHKNIELITKQSHLDYDFERALRNTEKVQKLSVINDTTLNVLRSFGYIGLKNYSRFLGKDIININELNEIPNNYLVGKIPL